MKGMIMLFTLATALLEKEKNEKRIVRLITSKSYTIGKFN